MLLLMRPLLAKDIEKALFSNPSTAQKLITPSGSLITLYVPR